jgi:hypothetical protein
MSLRYANGILWILSGVKRFKNTHVCYTSLDTVQSFTYQHNFRSSRHLHIARIAALSTILCHLTLLFPVLFSMLPIDTVNSQCFVNLRRALASVPTPSRPPKSTPIEPSVTTAVTVDKAQRKINICVNFVACMQ